MKPPAWVPALVLSLGAHLALVLPALPSFVHLIAAKTDKHVDPNGYQLILGFAIGFCVLIAIWTAMVTNILAKPSNKWGGVAGIGLGRLIAIVVGLTLALDVLNSPCFYMCPPLGLVIPVLSCVAVYNNSMPPPDDAPVG